MEPITEEWINKAEGDWFAAQCAFRAYKYPNYDVACFGAYESADKYLKARLAEAAICFENTIPLKKTMKLAFAIEPTWKILRSELTFLSGYTQDYLYPGKDASKDEAKDAIESCRRVRKVIRSAFGLPV